MKEKVEELKKLNINIENTSIIQNDMDAMIYPTNFNIDFHTDILDEF